MEQPGKVRQITKKEAKEIDPTKVAYFTLSDGTVFIVKDNMKPENLNQNIQEQAQLSSEYEQINNNIQTQSQNTQEIPQIDSNFGYNISSEGDNMQQSSMNAKLVNAQLINQSQIQGQKRQLYKLIEAIPVRFCDVQGFQFMNQSNNIQLNLQQYNNDTYVVEKSHREYSSNYQVNTQSSGRMCNCKLEQKKEVKVKCCCPIGNPALREEMEIVSPETAKKYEQYKKMKISSGKK